MEKLNTTAHRNNLNLYGGFFTLYMHIYICIYIYLCIYVYINIYYILHKYIHVIINNNVYYRFIYK